jgi:hypothetical protein
MKQRALPQSKGNLHYAARHARNVIIAGIVGALVSGVCVLDWLQGERRGTPGICRRPLRFASERNRNSLARVRLKSRNGTEEKNLVGEGPRKFESLSAVWRFGSTRICGAEATSQSDKNKSEKTRCTV